MFSRSKEPGAPVLPSGSVVLFADPKQGHLLVPLSIGCLMLTPIGVNIKHPMLKGTSKCPCFGSANKTTLPLGKTGAPGSFDLLNIDGSHGGTGGPTLANWILKGYSGYLPIGSYLSDTGAKWNDSSVDAAIAQRLNGPPLLFPVYDILSGSGANAQYHVVSWAAFHLTSFTASGSSGSITGWFEEVDWDG